MSKRTAIFPGSFDPFTKGHEDIVLRGSKLFDEVIIAIGINPAKKRYFDIDMMHQKISDHFSNKPNISVQRYETLTGDFAKIIDAKYILRGLRNTTDFEYENTIAQANKHVYHSLETVFLITSPKLSFISSTIVRELYNYGSNISEYIPFDLD